METKKQLADIFTHMPCFNHFAELKIWIWLKVTKEYEKISKELQVGKIEKSWGLTFYNQRIWIPQDEKFYTMILAEKYDTTNRSHAEMEKTLESIQWVYYYSRIREYVETYILSCVAWQHNKTSYKKLAGILQPLTIPK